MGVIFTNTGDSWSLNWLKLYEVYEKIIAFYVFIAVQVSNAFFHITEAVSDCFEGNRTALMCLVWNLFVLLDTFLSLLI